MSTFVSGIPDFVHLSSSFVDHKFATRRLWERLRNMNDLKGVGCIKRPSPDTSGHLCCEGVEGKKGSFFSSLSKFKVSTRPRAKTPDAQPMSTVVGNVYLEGSYV